MATAPVNGLTRAAAAQLLVGNASMGHNNLLRPPAAAALAESMTATAKSDVSRSGAKRERVAVDVVAAPAQAPPLVLEVAAAGAPSAATAEGPDSKRARVEEEFPKI